MRYISKFLNEWGLPLLLGIVLFFSGEYIIKIFSIKLITLYLEVFPTRVLNAESTGVIGDTLGGTTAPILGLIVIFVTFLAFWVQFRANVNQRNDIRLERFNNKFYEMIRFHRENVTDLSYTSSRRLKKEKKEDEILRTTATSRKVFKVIYSDFEELYNEIKPFFLNKLESDIYDSKYLLTLKGNKLILERTIDLINFALIDITYCIVFIGIGRGGKDSLVELLSTRYKSDFFYDVLNFAQLKPKEESSYWTKWKELNALNDGYKTKVLSHRLSDLKKGKKTNFVSNDSYLHLVYENLYYDTNYDKYYGGHQHRLGHYFRHFYQAVTYINNSSFIDYHQKYEHIKLLRAQLSTYEQIVLFLNSLSGLGRVWEFEKKHRNDAAPELNDQLITKFNLVKNFSSDMLLKDISVSKYYPLVSYETGINEEKRGLRRILVKKYK